MSLDLPEYRDVEAAVSDRDLPAVGDRLVIDGQPFKVLAVYESHEDWAGMLRDGERAIELRVQRDDAAGGGATELRPGGGPPRLSAGAEADPPTSEGPSSGEG